MTLTYLTILSGTQSGLSGTYLLDEGVSVDGTSNGYVLRALSSTNLTVQIDGIAAEMDTGEATVGVENSSHSSVVVGETGSVQNDQSATISMSGDHHSVTNFGTVIGSTRPILIYGDYSHIVNHGTVLDLGDGTDSSHGLSLIGAAVGGGAVINTGRVRSDNIGITISSEGASFFNSGKVIAEARALNLLGTGYVAENTGLLKSGDIGVAMDGLNSQLDNAGKIVAQNEAVWINKAATLINTGVLRTKTDVAVQANDAAHITNRGLINGHVQLSDMDDTYIAKGKGTVEGGVYGTFGDDLLVGSKADDFLNGGGDMDTIRGGAGKDLISGGTESDVISGGRGNDQLYGDRTNGLGGDIDYFQFFEKKTGKDRIKDFEDGVDKVQLLGSRLSGDLAALLPDALSENDAGDAVLDLALLGDMKGKIIFEGVAMADIDVSDFEVFVF